jgi:homoserine kinase type II
MTLSALAVETAHHPVPAPHLAHLSKAYRLGLIRKVTYLPLGLMNQNWRLDTDAGSFALKRIVDVPIPVARRNLSVLAGLAAHGVPSCPPRRTTDDDTVTNVDGVGYCLLPWVAGTHIDGTELTPGQAHELGVTVGQIHPRAPK